ncbi:hypothetical protein Ddc_22861 [Ditylenchus destructor]|nr:hypothetical protein Ddc_22861 [Ditylenchus destructor]
MSYAGLLNYIEAWITFICLAFTIVLASHLIWCIHTKLGHFVVKLKLSKSLLIYLYMHFVLSILSIPFQFYLIISWRSQPPIENPYSAQLLFWLGLWTVVYSAVAPVGVLILTLDRSMTLAFSLNYHFSKRVQNFVLYSGVCLMALVFLSLVVFNLMELPLDLEKTAGCRERACVFVKHGIMPSVEIKTVICTVELFFIIVFFILLKKNAYIGTVSGTPVGNYFGAYGSMMCALYAMLCIAYYTAVLLQRRETVANSSQRGNMASKEIILKGLTTVIVHRIEVLQGNGSSSNSSSK